MNLKIFNHFIFYIWLSGLLIYFGRTVFDYAAWTGYVQLLVVLINILCAFKCVTYYWKSRTLGSKLLRIVTILLTIFSLYFSIAPESYYAFNGEERQMPLLAQYKLVLFSLSSFYSAYYFAKKECFTALTIQIIFLLGVILAVGSFYKYSVYLMFINENESNVNNYGYAILALAPFAYFCKRYIHISYLLLSLFITLLSAKRGAILLCALLIVFFIYKEFGKIGKYYKIIYLTLLSCIFILFVYHTADYYELLLLRFTEQGTDSSGRTDIWMILLEAFFNSNFFAWIFGCGFGTTIKYAGAYAHNDWVEILFCHGIVGFFVYLRFYLTINKIRKITSDKIYNNVITVSLLCMLINTTMQMSIYLIDTAMYITAIAICAANTEKSTCNNFVKTCDT